MKKLLPVFLMMNLVVNNAFANGPTGTANIDAKYLKKQNTKSDTVTTKSSSLEKKTIHEIEENPRNPAMVESFGQVGSKEDDQERMEESKTPSTHVIKKDRDNARP